MALRGANGTCTTPTFVTPPPGEFWSAWPPAAAAIVANAGRRSGTLPDPVPLPLSPPAAPLPNGGDVCVRLAVLPCDPTNDAQRWFVSVDAEGAPVRTRSITFSLSVKTSRISTKNKKKGPNYLIVFKFLVDLRQDVMLICFHRQAECFFVF
jgi:hypothetical protein